MSLTFNLGTHAHNRAIPPGGYRSGKAIPPYNNPIGMTTGMIRPLTNKDPTNTTVYKFGSQRPIRQYRNGIVTNDTQQVTSHIRSSNMVSKLIDYPAGYIIFPKQSEPNCTTCSGVPMVSTWQPSVDLSNNPSILTTSKEFCCNEEYKAINRVKSADTNLSKRYYTNTAEYLYGRCQTFGQRQFNYLKTGNPVSKPGGPLAVTNTYNANCNPNFVIELGEIQQGFRPEETMATPSGCSNVIYKPNNYKFAYQGAVSSSTRILQLTVDAVKKSKGLK